jgi:hypothetical protein
MISWVAGTAPLWPAGHPVFVPGSRWRETEAKDADQPHRIKYRKLSR